MYRETAPNRQLQPFLECLWTHRTETSGAASAYRVLPDGCVDLIFDLTAGCETAFWVGTMTKSLVVNPIGPRHLLGLRFHPGAARGVLARPLKELTDLRASFELVTPSVEAVLDELVRGEGSRADIVQRWLAEVLVPDRKFSLIQSISRCVRERPGQVKVGDIASRLGLSSQYLNRIMSESVGVDLKTFCRIIRMRSCTQSLRASGSTAGWSAVAAEFGFYDQSHLIHEFNDLVGVSPGQFLSG
jgi:AraC-like DNA-binding protein